jgi:hypothetical protein
MSVCRREERARIGGKVRERVSNGLVAFEDVDIGPSPILSNPLHPLGRYCSGMLGVSDNQICFLDIRR